MQRLYVVIGNKGAVAFNQMTLLHHYYITEV